MAFGWPKTKIPPLPLPPPRLYLQSPIANPNAGQPAQANGKKPSDQRFRSFAERYIIARAHFFRVPLSEHTEDQWSCVMDAKRVYAMIERVGQNIEPEEGVF